MPKKVEIIERTRLYDGFFKLDEVRLRHERFDGTMSGEVSRLVFERGDSVAVLLYDRARDTVLLTEQFRCPAYLRGDDGWLLEIVAGIKAQGTTGTEVAHRELLEETGYRIESLEYLLSFYPSPGASTERIHLYLGYMDQGYRIGPGGGVAGEHEDIRLLEVPFQRALQMIEEGDIRDGKTIIALQHLALRLRSAV